MNIRVYVEFVAKIKFMNIFSHLTQKITEWRLISDIVHYITNYREYRKNDLHGTNVGVLADPSHIITISILREKRGNNYKNSGI